jgi:glycosyltransferase involved in cell wall biosynthesis
MARQLRRVIYIDHAAEAGGAEQSLLELLPLLDRQLYTPVLAHAKTAQWVQTPTLNGVVRVAAIGDEAVWETRRDELRSGVLAGLSYYLEAWRPVLTLARTIKEQQAEIVHTNALKSHLLGGMAAHLARRPLIWHVRDILSEPPARQWLLQAARRLKPYIIAISEAVAAQFEPLRGQIPLRVIHNGIPLDKFAPAPPSSELRESFGLQTDQPVVMVVGRLTPWKGHTTLLQAMRLVYQQFPRVKLLVVGAVTFWEDAYQGELQALVNELGLADCVQWLGFRSDVSELLRLCDVFVLPSVNEPFGRALVEAMACGKPVIGTQSGGVPEVVPAATGGLLVPPGEVQPLADAICQLLADPALRRTLGENGWRRANRYFDLTRVVREVQEVYAEIKGR